MAGQPRRSRAASSAKRSDRSDSSLRGRPSASPLCQVLNQLTLAINERLLLGPSPALHLPLCCDRVGNPIEMVRPNQLNGSTRVCVTARIGANLVFRDSLRQIIACRDTNVVRGVGATKHVDESTHLRPSSWVVDLQPRAASNPAIIMWPRQRPSKDGWPRAAPSPFEAGPPSRHGRAVRSSLRASTSG